MIDDYWGVMIYDAGDIPSKLVSKHTFPDGIESMFIEKKNDIFLKKMTRHIQFSKQTKWLSSNPWVNL